MKQTHRPTTPSREPLKRFLLKGLLFLLPVFLLATSFVIADPFRLFKTYTDYSENMYVIPNRDFISTQVYLKNNPVQQYNSFIFGSSRTIAYRTYDWSRHLESDARPFMFDASGESLFGIYTKICYIDRHHGSLKNVLIILDTDCTFAHEYDHSDHLGIKDPEVAGTSWLRFYWTFFKAYLDRPFFKSYWRYRLKDCYDASMAGYIENRHIRYNVLTNDVYILNQDASWAKDTAQYYKERESMFYQRPRMARVAHQKIFQHQYQLFDSIQAIFKRQHTNYRIIISPLYDQICFNPKDLVVLNQLFPGQVYDFSGRNRWTEDKHNYYENSHYRPSVGHQLLDSIYKQPVDYPKRRQNKTS